MTALEISSAVCEEFTDTILVDKKAQSLIVNIDQEWFNIVDEKLTQLGLKIVHKSKIKNGYTCTYIPRC